MLKTLATLLTVASLSVATARAEEDIQTRLANSLNRVLPDTEITAVRPAPLPGLYEVMIGPDVLYMSEDGRHVFRGDLYDLDQRRNISNERRSQARVSAFDQLYPNKLIEFAAQGQQKHVIYVYTDIDCTYCRKLHQGVDYLNQNGVTVRYLAFPRAGIGSKSYDTFVSAWCADDNKQALTDAKAGKQIASASCDAPVREHYELGRAMNVQGTPSIYGEDGNSLGGYIPAKELVQYLNQNG